MARMAGIGVHRLVERGDAHRALALAVDLRETIAEGGLRALEIGLVHRPAAIDDGFQAGMLEAAGIGVLGETPDHRRRGEQGYTARSGISGATPRLEERKNLGGIEAAAGRQQLAGAARRMWQDIKPRAV